MWSFFRTTAESAPLSRAVLRHARPGWFGRARHLRSLALLVEHLDAEQRRQFEKHGVFHVIGSDTGKRYAIRVGRAANILECENDHQYIRSWCFQPAGNLPIGDVLLAQKLALEVFEHDALGAARSQLRLTA